MNEIVNVWIEENETEEAATEVIVTIATLRACRRAALLI